MESKHELDLLEELKMMRYLETYDEEIDRYEEVLFELAATKNISVISELCNMAEDNLCKGVIGEYLVEAIVSIVQNNNKEDAIYEVIKGTNFMLPHAKSLAKTLHSWIIISSCLKESYINSLYKISNESKKIIKIILEELKQNNDNTVHIDEILNII